MTYWTMTDMQGQDPLTLCEPHALDGTNAANMVTVMQDGGFGSMAEAALMIETLAALAGIPSPISSSEEGECAACLEGATIP